MLHRDPRAERYGEALLGDAGFLGLLDADLAAEQRGEADPGLDREEFLARYKDVLEPPVE